MKKYPTSTSQVAKMLGLKADGQDLPLASFSPGAGMPVGLPIGDLGATEPLPSSGPRAVNQELAENPQPLKPHKLGVKDNGANGGRDPILETSKLIGPVKAVKAAAPYVMIFGLGLFLYYFFFTAVDFSKIFNFASKVSTPKESLLVQLQRQDLANYQNWISGFYYDINDSKVIDPDADNSGNGLSNFQKYLLNLNPKAYDTLGTGLADSQMIASGLDPSTGAALSEAKKDIVSKYLDMEVVMNRLTLHNLRNPATVAGVNTNGIFSSNSFIQNQPQIPPTPVITGPDSGDLEINTEIPGRLEIKALEVNAPIMWTKDPKYFDKDLQSGVVHYPGTALPGQLGMTYIAGHSSNVAWAKGNFNQVFAKLGNLANNSSFKITVVQKNGKDAVLHYVVTRKKEYSPTDQSQFAYSGKSEVALSTCWPIGSTAKRLVLFGELTQVEKLK